MRRAPLLALLAVLALAGCGGTTPPPRVAKPPHIPRALAHAWADQADAVAAALAARDGCTALAQANALRAAVEQAQARVPARLRVELVADVDALPSRITCNPPPPAPPPPPDHGKGKDHGKHHGHDQGDQG